MSKRIIIADASPLIIFGHIKQLDLIIRTLGKIIIPKSVLTECVGHKRPGEIEILSAINKGQLITREDPSMDKYLHLPNALGRGEATAIVLASELKVGLLIDEKLGRRTAKKMNIPIIGTAGTLLLAKKKKIIPKIEPLIHELKSHGYFLSEKLIKETLTKAKENK